MTRRFKIIFFAALAVASTATAPAQEDPSQYKIAAVVAAMKAKDYEHALVLLDRLGPRESRSAHVANIRGAIFTELKRWDDAEQEFRWALEKDPNFWPARFNTAALFFHRGQYEECRKAMEAFLATAPGHELTIYTLFLVDLLTRPETETDAIFAALTLPPQSIAYRYCQIAAALKKDKQSEARHLIGLSEQLYSRDECEIYSELLQHVGWLPKKKT